ncbi:MAG: electron transfer flavoprotein subunit beta/FixA family protein [Chloroflexi bacterium]|jgi:electron transfer flavoprotein beta subunit|nr:electron transfer flavoprotein subunit beta/FixA family protein [Chloroflexota bacterium]
MRVLVCIKRVPEVAGRITLTDEARAIDTKYVGFTVGPHEECAVEEAVRLIEAHGGESVVLTLGPAEALDQLRDAMALGVSRAIHLVTDGEEWDGESTAAAVVDAIRADEAESGPFDIVLLGNEAADSGGYQVGVRIGRALGRSVVTGIKGLTVADGTARCEQEAGGGRDVYELRTPAIVGVLEGINLPRYPSVPGRLRAKSKPVAASTPARPAQRLEMIRLVVPQAAAKEAQVLGHGPDAAPAVVALLQSVGLV